MKTNWIEPRKYILSKVDDHPKTANPYALAIKTYIPAPMKTRAPIDPSIRQKRIGNLEKENIASAASRYNLRILILGVPLKRSSLTNSTKPCLKPIKVRRPGRYLTFSFIERRASAAVRFIME